MKLKGKKIGILMESDFYEPEIFYYQRRFLEEGAEVHLLSRLWGQQTLTFKGHEYQLPIEVSESFEDLDDEKRASFAAIIVPAGMVSDRLRYTDDLSKIPPASALMKSIFENRSIVKGIICHGLWLMAPVRESIKGRKLVCHNNLYGDALAYGAEFVDEDVVVDGDLVTARTGGHAHLFARTIIDLIPA